MITLREHIKSITHDAIIWLSLRAWANATNTIGQDNATKEIIDLLLAIPAQVRRDAYVKAVADAINKEVIKRNAEIAVLEKQIKHEVKITSTLDGENKDTADQVIALLQEDLETRQQQLLPSLAAKDLLKYVKLEADNRDKERKAKSKTKFDNLGSATDAEADDDDDKDPWSKAPKWMNVEEVKEKGFTLVVHGDGKAKKFGYYSYDPNEKSSKDMTNFSITPIFHITGNDSRHLIEIDNGFKRKILEVESKAMISPDLMAQLIVRHGNFVIYASKLSWLRIASCLLQEFRECNEVKSLGWQSKGFYAFVNCIYDPTDGVKELDEFGVIEHKNQYYLIPAACPVYRELIAKDDDVYINDRPIELIKSTIKFNDWANRMVRVYQEKGLVGVAYCVLCVFRDIANSIDNNFPHLYFFGERSSGKTKFAESVSSFFFHNRKGFNLNSGTNAAFFAYVSKFTNTLSVLNEFDEKVIKDEWFQAIKGFYDGESRQRMNAKDWKQSETQQANSGVVLVGQYLVTKDDNSVVSRSIIEPFHERELTEADKVAYNELKDIEQNGITSLIIDLLEHREYFKEEFKDVFNDTISDWRAQYPTGGNFNQRIMQNWAHLYTALYLATKKISIPAVDIAAFKKYCFDAAGKWCKFIRSSDTLSEFWNTLLFLAESKQIQDGWDYKIVSVTSLTVRKNRDETEQKTFVADTKVLYLRINNIHKLYQQAYRSRTGKEGMSVENLLHYFSSRAYYIGAIKNTNWHRPGDNKPSSGYAFFYDQLEIDLETETTPFTPKGAEKSNYFANASKDDPF